MSDGLHRDVAVTTERGLDPRDFTLFACGGKGPLRISLVARELGIGRVVVPPVPAVFAARGMLMADVRHDLVLSAIRRLSTDVWAEVCLDYDGMEQNGLKVVLEQGVAEDRIGFRRYADMRYVGQEHSLTVELPSGESAGAAAVDALKAAFDRAHGERFGHNAADEEAEFVTYLIGAALVGLVVGTLSIAHLGGLSADPSFATLLPALVGVAFIASPWAAVTPYLAERFRTSNRSIGFGLGCAPGVILPSFYATYLGWFGDLVGARYAPIVFLAIGGLLTVVGAALGPETRHTDLSATGNLNEQVTDQVDRAPTAY